MSTIIEIDTRDAIESILALEKRVESYNELTKHLVDLLVIYDNLDDQESEYAKSVLANINEMNEAVKSQEEAQGIYYRNVGDYYRNASE